MLARWFDSQGYQVTTHAFQFSPRMLRALPVAGAGLMVLAPVALAALLQPAGSLLALLVILSGLLLVLGTVLFLSLRGGAERADANLVAVRPGSRPATWLVAHLDTKAQGHSMAGRLVALWVMLGAVLLALGAAGWHAVMRLPEALAAAAALGLVMAGRLLVQGRLQGRTAGACDNASGLVALLTAASCAQSGSVGFVVTSAEEFGLAGARALALQRPELFRDAEVVNLDSLDDAGTLFVVHHTQASLSLAAGLRDAMGGVAPRVRLRRLPAGILVDSLPFARVAAGAVTLARLNWATLRRIHTPADAPGSLGYETAIATGEALARRFDQSRAGG